MKNIYLLVFSIMFCGVAFAQSSNTTPATPTKLQVKEVKRSSAQPQQLKVIANTDQTEAQPQKLRIKTADAPRTAAEIRAEIKANVNNADYDLYSAERELKAAEHRERQQQK